MSFLIIPIHVNSSFAGSTPHRSDLFRLRRFSSEEQFGGRLDHCVHVQSVGAIEIGQRAGLTEAVDAERAYLVAEYAAEPA
jgi:hypothetical protein